MKDFVAQLNEATLGAYAVRPGLIREHYGIEQTVLAGGYGYRQILELVQNGADAILEAQDVERPPAINANRIHVLLRGSYLYVANTGAPLSEEGLDSLLSSQSSPKRGNQIGRFGLGFKSLLRLGGKIDLFTNTSGGIRFDPQRCREELKKRFSVPEAPALRLAWPLDENDPADDCILNLMSWAQTIVRVEVQTSELLEHLRQEIGAFPAEFLLFFPVATILTLDDGIKSCRELRLAMDDGDFLLHDGADISRWRVAIRNISITDERAVGDATHIHARDSLPLAWAIPLDGRHEEAGRFWAFFPTHTPTHLPGILNAPWKLNSDRNAIIGGEWNTALMQEAACLVTETLKSLSTPNDPARPLDAFPRQLERKDDDAAPLVEAIWTALKTEAVIPDAAATLKPARELWRHPQDSAELARQWQALAASDELTDIVHASCLERQRGSRLNALAERISAVEDESSTSPNLRKCGANSWFASVASTETMRAVQTLKLAEAFANDCKKGDWNEIRPVLSIIPSQEGELMTANRVIFAPPDARIPNRAIVASALCEDAEAARILSEVMKVKSLDDSVWEAVLRDSLNSIPTYPQQARDAGWRTFWINLRAAPEAVRQLVVANNRNRIHVCRRDGIWVLADAVLLPGSLIRPDDTSANQDLLIDDATHGHDGAALASLGIVECPDGASVATRDFNALSVWLNECRHRYKTIHDNSASWEYLEPVGLEMPKGWGFLAKLSGASNAKLTERFIARIVKGEFVDRLKFGHCTVASYPKIDAPHPLTWWVLKHGTVLVGDGAVTLRAAVAKRHELALVKLANCEQLLAALERLEETHTPNPVAHAEIRDLWLALINKLATPSALADDSLRDLWAGAANDKVVPDALRAEVGEVPLSQVFVIGSPDLASRVRSPNRVVVTLDDDALKLWLSKGAKDLSELVRPAYASYSGPADLLVSAVPELADVLRSEAINAARCQPVTDLKLCVAETLEPIPCLMWDNTLLLDGQQLGQLSRTERLKLLVDEIAGAGWLQYEPAEALQHLGNARVDERRAEVASGGSLGERLMLAVGGREKPLREALGELADADFLRESSLSQLADLTLAQLGPATLPTLKDTLAAEGLKPPLRWNTAEARTFVANIQFPEEFAASLERRREAEEYISGPIELPPLHDFQQEVLEGIRALIINGATRRRAVVSLPTGGGKTRVTVEAAVLLVLKTEGVRRSVVWVAQTDELCEQAVQAFRQVWLNLGARRTDLRIIRLWGGHPNPAIQEPDKPVVVVASIQTLNSRMSADGLAWLRDPGLVVVDECHHAITPSYTNLLRWLDAESPRPAASEKDKPPIIGLSATPFRMDDEESQRLAKRFDGLWLPADQAQLHSRLLAQGVLADAVYEVLQSGTSLLQDEIDRLSQLPEPWEGLDFANIIEAINQRLAGDNERNQRLVNRIERCVEQSILFFTNSVKHAEEMSARLNLAGIPAAAVSGSTPSVARRYFLDRFQRGDIRVMCNHSVLTTGFDAPKTDMVLIARQVFSPVRYMQMVGRGLRGQQNGGTAQCRIVTVVDNLGRFQNRHPYHYCQRYFSEAKDTLRTNSFPP